MRFALPLLAILTVLAAKAPDAAAQNLADSHLQAARELLEVTNSKELMEQSMQAARQFLAMDSTQARAMAEFDDVIDEFMAERFRWSDIEPEFVQLYVDVFTEDELRQMTAFYQTDLGQKMLNRLPEVMQRSMLITQTRMQTALPELIQRLDAEMRRRRSRSPR